MRGHAPNRIESAVLMAMHASTQPHTLPEQTHWAREVQARPEAPRLWRALLRAFVPLNLSSYPLYFLASLARIMQVRHAQRACAVFG